MEIDKVALEALIDILPPNRPMYKKTGRWRVFTDDDKLILAQMAGESFRGFIVRYVDYIMLHEDNDEFDYNLSCLFHEKEN